MRRKSKRDLTQEDPAQERRGPDKESLRPEHIEMKEPCYPGKDVEEESSDDKLPTPAPLIFHNLAVKQKAVYQPTFKHRKWMEEEKKTRTMAKD